MNPIDAGRQACATDVEETGAGITAPVLPLPTTMHATASPPRPRPRLLAASLVPAALTILMACVYSAGMPLAAQSGSAQAANLASLVTYADFYTGRPVVVRGTLVDRDGSMYLQSADEDTEVLAVPAGAVLVDGAVEARGELWDVGRVRPDDPRLGTLDLSRWVRDPDHWPKPGDLVLFAVRETLPPAPRAPVVTIRSLVLEPERYVDSEVTVSGQFRGRNLYGDLPRSPGISRWDFVLRSGTAAIWAVGERPRGRGFDLSPDAKVDTDQWLEVRGTLKHARGLEWIEVAEIKAAKAGQDEAVAKPIVAPPPAPPPAVIFSIPTEGEADVRPSTDVRIQVSRDLKADSIKDRVRVEYLGETPPGETPPSPPAFTTSYQTGNRAIVITFAEPLRRFHGVKVDLLEGIEAFDGQKLPPWTLTFRLGG